MVSSKFTGNYIFRKFECGLSKYETSELCFKSVRTITRWDGGQDIPPECKRLMRMYTGREVGISESWIGWRITKENLISPNGLSISSNKVLTGTAILEIGAEQDSYNLSLIMKTARALRNTLKN
ncbi:regulator [Photobacterium indicum]|uniref:Regulator n=2 Tax=Photobacterium indicum TaxID=81447 RepID=A0A2T3L2U5_9GAMM|nr:regulator [Photobacterium indicum]